MNMDQLDVKLAEYVEKFGENFPTADYRYCTMAQIIEMIEDCLKKGKPMGDDTPEDVTI